MAKFKIPLIDSLYNSIKTVREEVQKLSEDLGAIGSKITKASTKISNARKETPESKFLKARYEQKYGELNFKQIEKERFATKYLEMMDKQNRIGLKSAANEGEKQGESFGKGFKKGVQTETNKSKRNTSKTEIKDAQERGKKEGKAYTKSFKKESAKIIKEIGNDLYKQFMKAYESRDMSKIGELNDILLQRLGGDHDKLSKIRNSISRQASAFYFGDVAYGKEARELKNLAISRAKMTGGRSFGEDEMMYMLMNGGSLLKNPEMLGYRAISYLGPMLKNKKFDKYIMQSPEYQKYAAKNANATVNGFMTNNPSQYTKAAKNVMNDETAMAAIASAGSKFIPIVAAITAIIKLGESIVRFGKESVEAYEKVEMLRTRLEVVYSSKSASDMAFNEIEAYAKKSPFGVETMTQQAILLKQSGVGSYKLMDTMSRIGDLASGNAEKMRSISEVYARVLASTTITARDMRQLANAGVPAYDALLNTLKTGTNPNVNPNQVSASNIRSLLQGGKITSQDFVRMVETLTDEGGLFYQATKKGAKTIQARKQNLSDMREMARAYVGQNIVRLGEKVGGDSFYDNVLKILEDINEGVEATAKNTSISKNDKVIRNNEEKFNSYMALANTASTDELREIYINKAKEYGQTAKERLFENLAEESIMYDQLLEDFRKEGVKGETQSTFFKQIKEKIIEQNGFSKYYDSSMALADVANKLLGKEAKGPLYYDKRGKFLQDDSIKNFEEDFMYEVGKLMPAKAFVSFEEALLKGSEALNEFVDDINGSQARMTKARTAYENSGYWQHIESIDQYYKDAQLKNEITSNQKKFINKDGSVNFSDIPLEYRKRFYETMISDASALKVSRNDLFLDANGTINKQNVNQWETYSENLYKEFLPALYGFIDKYKDDNKELMAFLQPMSAEFASLYKKKELSLPTVAGHELTRFLFVDKLFDFKNKNKDNESLVSDIENLLYVLDATTAKKGFDVSNAQYLNKNANALAWQTVAGNALGITPLLVKQLYENTRMGSFDGQGSSKKVEGNWTGADIFNKIFKDNMSSRKTFSGLFSTLGKAGVSLTEIAANLKEDKTKRDKENELSFVDWVKSEPNIKDFANKLGVTGQEALLSEEIARRDEVVNMLASGITSGADWEKIIDPQSVLGQAFNVFVKEVEESGQVFEDNITEAANRFVDSQNKAIAQLNRELVLNRTLEQNGKDVANKMFEAQLLARGTNFLNLNSTDIYKRFPQLTNYFETMISQIRDANFTGYINDENAERISSLLGLDYTLDNFDRKEIENKLKELDNSVRAGGADENSVKKWISIMYIFSGLSSNASTLAESFERLEKTTKNYEDVLERGKTRERLVELAGDVGYKGLLENPEGPLSEFKGRKFRTIWNNASQKKMLQLFGFDENLRLNTVYSKGGDILRDIMSGTDLAINTSIANSENAKLKNIIANKKTNLDYAKFLQNAVDEAADDAIKNLEGGLKGAEKSLEKEYRNILKIYKKEGDVSVVQDFINSKSFYSDNPVLQGYKNDINKILALKSDAEKDVAEQLEAFNQAERNAIDNLMWKNINVEPSMEKYVNKNKDMLSLTGQYLINQNGGEKLLEKLKKSGYGEDSIEYRALEEKLKSMRDETGSFTGNLEDVANILYQIGETTGFDSLAASIMNGVSSLQLMQGALEELAVGIKDAFSTNTLNGYLNTMKQIGANMYDIQYNALSTEDAEEKLANTAKSAASGFLEQTSALLTNAGLAIAQAGALDHNWGAVAGGLLMAAAGGIANVSAGFLSASTEDSDDDDKLERIEALKNNLADLIEQARNDATYYEETLRHKSALSYNEGLSATKVNDMILTPQGNFSTHPDDYLIATKNPSSLGSSSPNISFSIMNNGEPVTVESSNISQDSYGNFDIEIAINSMVKKSMLNGEYSDTFAAMSAMHQGNVVSA